MNSGNYHAMLSASRCAVRAHKSKSDAIVKRSEGQTSTWEKNGCGVSVGHPNVCSDRAMRQAGRWREAQAGGAGYSPSQRQVRLQPSLKDSSEPEPSRRAPSPKKFWNNCPQSQRRWQAQKGVTRANSICWPHSSSPETGLLVPVPRYKMNQTVQIGERRLSGLQKLCFQFPRLKKEKRIFPGLRSGAQRCCVDWYMVADDTVLKSLFQENLLKASVSVLFLFCFVLCRWTWGAVLAVGLITVQMWGNNDQLSPLIWIENQAKGMLKYNLRVRTFRARSRLVLYNHLGSFNK